MTSPASPPDAIRRMQLTIQGTVQGVGFRPFVFRLAESFALSGWVINSAQGVVIDIEGPKDQLNAFLLAIETEKPPLAAIYSLESCFLDPVGYTEFEVRTSDAGGSKTALVLPDIATCPDCLAEIFDPTNRRYLYPFTNCTNCGPRFSIIRDLPYDRPATTMAAFDMCDQCRAEYTDPRNRRFHAQPNACQVCGPRAAFLDAAGNILSEHQPALTDAAEALKDGHIVAIKGIGGFHLMVDAGNEEAVRRLRLRKQREHKPLAMMFPATNALDAVDVLCYADALEKRLLRSPEAPIVLLRSKGAGAKFQHRAIAPSVSPKNPYCGVMLPYTPLHHILMHLVGFPLVATSGNLSEEPICTDETEAVRRLAGICDYFLVHNRPIARHVDDSIVCVRSGRQQVLRRARGFAPLPIVLPDALLKQSKTCVCTGAHLKNTIALTKGKNVFVSQHIGDLESPKALDAFKCVIADLQRLWEAPAESMATDLHPGYASTRYAESADVPVIRVQHHHAHILSCMAENHLPPPVLGLAWDGTGFGPDNTIWGGEFLKVTDHGFERVAHFRTFSLPGGDRAVKEPRRSAVGLLYEIMGDGLFSASDLAPLAAFSDQERQLLPTMLKKRINTYTTSSLGRLFDAVSALLDISRISQFEGQAAMALEFLAETAHTDAVYPLALIRPETPGPVIVDWEPMIREILDDVAARVSPARIAAAFHNTVAEAGVEIARLAGETRVVLSGGCFQNRYLTEKTIVRLSQAGFSVYWHQRVPPNDGGISLGQAVAAAMKG